MLLKLSDMIVNFGPGCVARPYSRPTGPLPSCQRVEDGKTSIWAPGGSWSFVVDETVEEIWKMLKGERLQDEIMTIMAQKYMDLDKEVGDESNNP